MTLSAVARPLLLALALALGAAALQSSSSAQTPVSIVVTSAEDVAGECPHDANCTLRTAIEAANADVSGEDVLITFEPAVFDPDDPATIALSEPLPQVTRDDVTIDGTDAGVRLDGGSLEGIHDGLFLVGSRAAVRGLSVHNFGGICVALSGESSRADGNRIGGCGTAIYANAANAVIQGNTVGFAADSDNPSGGSFAVVVNASDVLVGDPNAGPSTANLIGNFATAIRVGDVLGPEFEGVVVAGNIIGKTPSGDFHAPVTTGIELRPPSNASEVLDNLLANVTAAAVAVAPDSGGLSTTGNRIAGNRFEGLHGLPIDLGGNGVSDANDASDADTGPNTMLNHPVVTRAVQSEIEGTACPGCEVHFYAVAHTAGGTSDFATTPLAGGTVTANGAGFFAWEAPPVTPGQWIAAVAVDGSGNTSEFGASTRVGAGIVQCGNIGLQSGWNLVGYFGEASLPLGAVFPPEYAPASPVSAIYQLIDGTFDYRAWFAAVGPGRTLDSLASGEAYWMHAVQPVSLDGGFSLTVPLPVALKAGWNEFVYIGAGADIRDALATVEGKYTAVFRWSNAGTSSRWLSYHPGLPPWAQGFTQLQPCHAYSIFVTEDVTLSPLQP